MMIGLDVAPVAPLARLAAISTGSTESSHSLVPAATIDCSGVTGASRVRVVRGDCTDRGANGAT